MLFYSILEKEVVLFILINILFNIFIHNVSYFIFKNYMFTSLHINAYTISLALNVNNYMYLYNTIQ